MRKLILILLLFTATSFPQTETDYFSLPMWKIGSVGLLQPRTDSSALLITGNFGYGWTEPNLGAGTRLMWYPRKAAFRVGSVSSTQWDNANIGNYSVAMGYNGTVSADYSVVLGGVANIASGARSAVLSGASNLVSGGVSAVLYGESNTSSNTYSVSGGFNTTASGAYSAIFGAGYSTTQKAVNSTGRSFMITYSDLSDKVGLHVVDTTRVYIGGALGLRTNTPFHRLSSIQSNAIGLNAFNFVNSDVNTNRTSAATCRDSSSIHGYFSGSGSPTFGVTGKDGTTLLKTDSSATIIDKILVNNKSHGFYAFEDSAVTIAIDAQNTWYHVTNATGTLYSKIQDGAGFTMVNDTIQFTATDSIPGSSPHLLFHFGLDGEGTNAKTYQIRIYNVTQGIGLVRKATATALGAGTEIGMQSVAYTTVSNINDKFILQVRNITDDADFVVWDGSVYVEVSHY